jgi:hypothetical protein
VHLFPPSHHNASSLPPADYHVNLLREDMQIGAGKSFLLMQRFCWK